MRRLPLEPFYGDWRVEGVNMLPGYMAHVVITDGAKNISVEFTPRIGSSRFAVTNSFNICVQGDRDSLLNADREQAVRELVRCVARRDTRAISFPSIRECRYFSSEAIRSESEKTSRQRTVKSGSLPQAGQAAALSPEEIAELQMQAGLDRLTVFVVPASECTRKCIFCNADAQLQEAGREESEREFIRMNRRIGAKKIVFSGNEPLVNPGLEGLIRLAKENGFVEIVVQTPGGARMARVSPEMCAAAGATHMEIPLYAGNAAVHDAVVGCPGAFDETVECISRARAAGIKVALHTLILRQNLEHLGSLSTFLDGVFPGILLRRRLYHPTTTSKKDFARFVPRYAEIVAGLNGVVGNLPLPVCLKGEAINDKEQSQMQLRFMAGVQRVERLSLKAHYPACCANCAARDCCCGISKMYEKTYGCGELQPVK